MLILRKIKLHVISEAFLYEAQKHQRDDIKYSAKDIISIGKESSNEQNHLVQLSTLLDKTINKNLHNLVCWLCFNFLISHEKNSRLICFTIFQI